MVGVRAEVGDQRMQLVGMIYRLHGALRSNFAGPNASTGLVLLEALALGVIVIDGEPPTVSEIGRALGYTRQSIQRAVNKLLALGLVTAEPNPRHKAAPIFVPTETGVARMKAVQAPSRQLAADLVDLFDDERAQRLLGELTDLLAAIRDRGRPSEDE